MGEIVRSNREAVKKFQKLFGQHRVGGQLAHHDQAQAFATAGKPVLCQQVDHLARFAQGAYKRHHDLDIAEAHRFAHPAHRLAFHCKTLAKTGRDITRRAAKTQHRVLFIGLVAITAHQLLVFVGFEIRQPHNHRLGPEGARDRGHAFGHLVDEEGSWRGIAARRPLDRRLQFRLKRRIVEHRLGMDADIVVDHEFQARQTDTRIGQALKFKGQLRIADVHRNLHRNGRQVALRVGGDLEVQSTGIDIAGVTFGA